MQRSLRAKRWDILLVFPIAENEVAAAGSP